MQSYLLVLGNTPELSLAEISALVHDQVPEIWSNHLAEIKLENDEQAQQLQQLLGGVFKIIKVVCELDSDSILAHQQIVDFLFGKSNKVTFGITNLAQSELVISDSQLKRLLKDGGQKARFRQGSQWGLSAAITQHEPTVFDLFVIKHDDKFYLAQAIAAQNLDEWIAKDRKKPYVAGKKGMLPPKLARIMVNLGLGSLSQSIKNPVLYDPFCGTGTVLIEGLLRGCKVIGSDLDKDAVAGSLENLYWLEDYFQQQFKYQVFKSDVASAAQQDWKTKVDLIVTEPFLGKPRSDPNELDNIFKGLTSMYLGAFKEWSKILNNGATVTIVFPTTVTSKKSYNLMSLIDKLASYGYTLQVNPINYARKKAVIVRQILVFKYKQ